MFKIFIFGLIVPFAMTASAYAACPTFPYSFTNGSTADATQVNSDFNNVITCFAPLASPSFTGSVGIGTSSPATALDIETSTSNSSLQIGAATSQGIKWYSSSGGSDQKYWDEFTTSTYLQFRAVNDAYTAATNWLQINRGSGYTITSITFPSGNVGIGTTAPSYLLQVGSSSVSGIVMELQNSSGACTHSPGASSETVTCTSDAKLKSDIHDSESVLSWIDELRIRDFTVNSTGERKTGVVAQEILAKRPEMVHRDSGGSYAVDQPNPWQLVKAIQEQQAEIDQLKAELAAVRTAK